MSKRVNAQDCDNLAAPGKDLSTMATSATPAQTVKRPKQSGQPPAVRSRGQEPVPPPQAEIAEDHKGRRAGKRSDPAFRPTTIFVRKETQRKATRLLEDHDTGKDFSDLVEELLTNWIHDHSRA